MEILILGNGFECQYNPNVRDFNSNFIKFISNEEEVDKLLAEIFQFCSHDKKIYKNIVRLIKNEISFEENFALEDKLRLIGEKVAENNRNKDEIFHCVKNLVGFYIYAKTKDYEDIDNYLEFRTLYRPDEIWTTNYTDSAKKAYFLWDKNDFSDVVYENYTDFLNFRSPEKVNYLHGEFKFLSKEENNIVNDNTFENIEINLLEKNETILGNLLTRTRATSNYKNKNLTINIFGLSIRNDVRIFYDIVDKLNKIAVNYEINLYYNTPDDRTVFSGFKSWVEKSWTDSERSKSESSVEPKINLFPSKEYKGFKLKNKQS